MIAGMSDTIAAIATPIGEGGIGIVRISGRDALAIADRIFISKNGKKPTDYKTYTVHYGWIAVSCQHNIIDEVILTVMRAPNTYTREDVVEINCHGGIVALRAILDLVLVSGARLAEQGEFTKRAFLNGRIDLVQAEAVFEVIKAKTDLALKLGVRQLSGYLSSQIEKARKNLIDILSVIEANIDFPDEEIKDADIGEVNSKLGNVNNQLKAILEGAKQGRIFKDGISAVICGRPNVGKSSLLNAFLKQERSIVTPIAGTTRDTIEEIIDIRGIPVKIVDTAGILEPRDLVEKKAVARSKKYIKAADLIILVFDGSRKLDKDDMLLVRKLKGNNAIAIINKMDIRQKVDKEYIYKNFRHVISISAKKMKNINVIEENIVDIVYKGKIPSPELSIMSNYRHIEAARHAQKLIAETKKCLDNRVSWEFIAQGIKDALGYLDEILGKSFTEDLLDKIFSEFCIGK